jgi:hypothetical protein
MLAEFFVHDGGDTQTWRLKGHARKLFWAWVASWGAMVRSPEDLGHDASAYKLPPLNVHQHTVEIAHNPDHGLFALEAQTLSERRGARKESLVDRVRACAEIVNASSDTWLVWCDLNAEGDALESAIPGSVQVAGCDTEEFKERTLLDFAHGKLRVLISKPSICGFGLNFQAATNQAFVGVTDSFEAYYQAVRRSWRFGQKSEVNVHVFASNQEGAVVANLRRKEAIANAMADAMAAETLEAVRSQVIGAKKNTNIYQPSRQIVLPSFLEVVMNCIDQTAGEGFVLYHGDCVDVLRGLPDQSIHYSIFSPPFASLYTYSNSPRDMGNCRTNEEFFEHFAFLVTELKRVMRPGRNVSFTACCSRPAKSAMGSSA